MILVDTSGTQGQWHMWNRRWPQESDFVKCAEWIGGVTVQAGQPFNWLTSATDRLGNSKFRWPTVVNNNPYWHDYQDWCAATTETRLPRYN